MYYFLSQLGLGWLWFKDIRNQVQQIAEGNTVGVVQAEYTQVGRFIPRGKKPG